MHSMRIKTGAARCSARWGRPLARSRCVLVRAAGESRPFALPSGPVFTSLRTRLENTPGDNLLGRLYKIVLPGAAGYLPALLSPTATMLSTTGAVFGPPFLLDLAAKYLVHSDNEVFRAAVTGNPQLKALLAIAFSLTGALASFVVLPAADVLLGRDLTPETEEDQQRAMRDPTYRGVVSTYVLAYWAALLGSCHLAATHHVPALAQAGLVLSLGSSAGITFAVAHELVHSKDPLDRFLGASLLCTTGYMHWAQSHLAHHVKVATHEDPATARLGESFYAFLPRTVLGNLRDGYAAETRRLAAKGHPLLSAHNQMVWWLLCPAALAAVVTATCGGVGLGLLVGQAAVGVALLEVINYVEHYGLTRARLPSGRYEAVRVGHSWNANWMATSAVTFRLQRHADHHMFGSKPYQALQDMQEAPQLPASYPVMALLAMVPPAFFAVMTPRAEAAMQLQQPISSATLPMDQLE